MDETSWRENGHKAWLWTVVGSAATLFAIRPSRARKVVNELLGAEYQGLVGSDRYSAYSHLPDDHH
ncbi:MAG: transposase, partial [Planctomycetaceae bacterium]|nr:transposase [Planctomycetaceae bacterium]